MEGVYHVAVECDNCYTGGSVQIQKGTPVPPVYVCPNCGCETAHPCKPEKNLPFPPKSIPWSLPKGALKWGGWEQPHWNVEDIVSHPNFFPPQVHAHIGNQQ